MIAYIKGTLNSLGDESLIVDVGGIGYEIVCPNPFVFQDLLNQQIHIQTYHHVREDAQILFGFQNRDEKYLFTKLISVSGIGPKGALAILAGVDISGFIAAVENEDDKFLTSFPGVGKKTARQIILDLKGKLTSVFSITDEQQKSSVSNVNNNEVYSEAMEALKALGYTDKEVKQVLPHLKKDNDALSVDEAIRKALALLAK
ncbi:holliday junction DNA helicase [Oceanobacillus iheyensis HTE831]|uniref:Holliday junction branch migration complex subunit RuvA n=1 Tax=Oceanobacillus iheyensis (strain DSM 14371 / CIP 107618 / JCM 11309 / KCTC 3954 / HTE831) TaxID=221109 RepID=RUVA_OCEIH|nr:Holliday junction branch migration protein RuvA [Oceanobacillus iheyensis]Q8EPQ5.1 RecName: Full=Holliday junction branch migration complex subunit RuvA [Oceanobacillus iheyensis HTE831]BAC13993.1 holliday junction DNA helicase [Oceanobacillus iheyensis HTE831]